jgi:thioredoxin reductase
MTSTLARRGLLIGKNVLDVFDQQPVILTGAEAGAGRYALETTLCGVFAIGDVRATSVKRVAAAVGEGAQVVAALHAYLAGAELSLSGIPTPTQMAQ